MCDSRIHPVSLHKSGRTFTCLYCSRIRQHPPFDLLYHMLGHAFCDLCGRWMPIKNYQTFASEEEYEAARRRNLTPKS